MFFSKNSMPSASSFSPGAGTAAGGSAPRTVRTAAADISNVADRTKIVHIVRIGFVAIAGPEASNDSNASGPNHITSSPARLPDKATLLCPTRARKRLGQLNSGRKSGHIRTGPGFGSAWDNSASSRYDSLIRLSPERLLRHSGRVSITLTAHSSRACECVRNEIDWLLRRSHRRRVRVSGRPLIDLVGSPGSAVSRSSVPTAVRDGPSRGRHSKTPS